MEPSAHGLEQFAQERRESRLGLLFRTLKLLFLISTAVMVGHCVAFNVEFQVQHACFHRSNTFLNDQDEFRDFLHDRLFDIGLHRLNVGRSKAETILGVQEDVDALCSWFKLTDLVPVGFVVVLSALLLGRSIALRRIVATVGLGLFDTSNATCRLVVGAVACACGLVEILGEGSLGK